jgi:hypothetical protein
VLLELRKLLSEFPKGLSGASSYRVPVTGTRMVEKKFIFTSFNVEVTVCQESVDKEVVVLFPILRARHTCPITQSEDSNVHSTRCRLRRGLVVADCNLNWKMAYILRCF